MKKNSSPLDLELFNLNQLKAEVKTCGQMVPPLRQLLQNANEILANRFFKGLTSHSDQVDEYHIKTLVHRRAWLIDQVLRYIWSKIHSGNFLFSTDQLASLIAVGGYGRNELHPCSDIDLLILVEKQSPALKSAIENLVTLLWDIGLEIGHSVRSIEQCLTAAKEDVIIATTLMETRFIIGNEDLYHALNTAIKNNNPWPSNQFFKAKLAEQNARYYKYHQTEYNLEPDIKNAPGGLRDLQMISWVMKRHFQISSLKALIEHNFITEDEYKTMREGLFLLWRIRFALHLHTSRDENRLLFNYQQHIAYQFGHQDTNVNLAVEKFMKLYYRTAETHSTLNDVLLQHFDEAILQDHSQDIIIPINDRLQIRNSYIETKDENVFIQSPFALLEIFILMAQDPRILGIRAATVRQIRDASIQIDASFRALPHHISLFMDLLRSSHQLDVQLLKMKRYGLLGRYIPAFGQVIGQMQYDLFHIHTVDAHTLLVIKNMQYFFNPDSKERFPLAHRIIQTLPKTELLYLAGIFHDIAKGRGGDHSNLGAIDAESFCIHHNLNKWEVHLVVWLVKNHLLMSLTAQKKDISDPAVIHEFSYIVRDQIHLDYLYVLTVADIFATNPSLWNSWRDALLRQLYSECKRTLYRGLEQPIDKQERITENWERALVYLRLSGIKRSDVISIWRQLDEDYFLRETPENIAWHIRAIIKHPKDAGPLVLMKNNIQQPHVGGSQIFIYTENQPNLFANTVAILDQLNLAIVDARIITSKSNFSLDTYIVLEANGQPIEDDPQRISYIRNSVIITLNNPSQSLDIPKRRIPRQLKHFNIHTNVNISNDLEQQRTIIEIRALDRPGLLALIGKIFSEFQIMVQNARIATLGECAEDIFFVTNQDQEAVTDSKLINNLQETLCKQLDQDLIENVEA